jgi:type II secretory pathway pseudopilin PulG
MQLGLKLRNYPIPQLPNRRRPSSGYILITLMLFLALLAISAMVVLPEVKRQLQRDQEEEMIHRGTEYMRAIKKYYKKFGRYPARLEELENTNNMRFLRKRYKDPIKKEDFRLLHMQDVMGMNNGAGLGRGFGPMSGQGGLGGLGGLGAQGGLGGIGGGNRGVNLVTPQGGGAQPPTGDQGDTGDDSGGSSGPPTGGGSSGGNSSGGASGSDSSGGDSGSSSGSPAGGSGPGGVNPGGPLGSNSGSGGPGLGGQVFGGGPILGVASKSKDKSIRIFNKKEHYNEWLFYYDPATDRGGLLVGPVQPGLNNIGGGGMLGSQPGGGLQGQSGLNGGLGGTPQPQQPQGPNPSPTPQPNSPEE